MDRISAIIVGAHTVISVFGGAITVFAYRAYTRTRSKQLKALAVAFGVCTVGTLVSLGGHQLGLLALLEAVALQSLAIAAGFVLLAYSLQTGYSATSPTGHSTR
ncbi:DUF7521 family protein [Natranaeroarchaeum sulfidigenes]|uniref:Putative membrane protein n=1 Tax=Natranaeroarchaeum sulfidigenes TaxID=2784880 RepID=A0A897MTT0_9EURY|nr:hypothetical protein [Natranaeroarchaeum sulfidigenes]QSG02453.1 putative membrane protein [Natranaeroarchaeum sulfidigenes]